MALWDDVKKAANEATNRRADLRQRFHDIFRSIRPVDTEPPTIVVDGAGNTALERKQGALAILGKSILLLIVSLAALGVTWLTTALIAAYLLLQRLLGLRVTVQQPAR